MTDTPKMTVAQTDEILEHTIRFADKMREVYDLHGVIVIFAKDAGLGRMVTLHMSTGLTDKEAGWAMFEGAMSLVDGEGTSKGNTVN
jgi:hypothetical protein